MANKNNVPAQIYTCIICGKKWDYRHSRGKLVCSRTCWLKNQSNIKLGKLNPNFKGGRDRTYRKIMKNILSCQNCGRQYKLEVHHKDGNHLNNVSDNLIKVCRKCHMILDGRITTWNKDSWKNRKKYITQEQRNKISEAKKKWWASKRGG
jgi:hypothetical protein